MSNEAQITTGSTVGTVNSQQGVSTALDISTATVVKAAAGRLVKIEVITAGSAAGTANDCTTTGAVATANEVATIPNTVGPIELDFPMENGIVIAPGTGQVVSVDYV